MAALRAIRFGCDQKASAIANPVSSPYSRGCRPPSTWEKQNSMAKWKASAYS